MKKVLTLIITLATLFVSANAQTQPLPERYVMVEHFTNTLCGLCASRNPTLYPVLDANADNLHHLRVHPSVPYSACPLYNHNTTDNESRRNFYGNIFGTPRVYLNGSPESDWGGGNPLILQSTLDNYLNQTSNLGIAVNVTGQNVSVELVSYDSPNTSSDLKLFVAVVEANLAFSGGNGENLHTNTLRDLIYENDVTLPANGTSNFVNTSFTLNSDWDANDIYIMAWVQDAVSFEVLNSGTNLDDPLPSIITSIEEFKTQALNIFPNPATDKIQLKLPVVEEANYTIYNLQGKLMLDGKLSDQQSIDIKNLTGGQYILEINSISGHYAEKFIVN